MRQLAIDVADKDPGFSALRAKIHNAPEADDAARVREYDAAKGRDAARPLYEELAAAIDRPVPSADKIREELRAERSQRREMKMMQENPLFKLAPDPQLGQLMVRMTQREAYKAADTKRIAGQMLKWAGDSKQRKTALAEYCRAVLKGKSDLHETHMGWIWDQPSKTNLNPPLQKSDEEF